jgi:hypothetical protein
MTILIVTASLAITAQEKISPIESLFGASFKEKNVQPSVCIIALAYRVAYSWRIFLWPISFCTKTKYPPVNFDL